MGEKKVLKCPSVQEMAGIKVYCKLENELIKATKNESSPFVATNNIKVQIYNIVQNFGQTRDDYRATSSSLLQYLLLQYPALAQIVINITRHLYTKMGEIRQRQAKLLAIGCVIKSGAVSADEALTCQLVQEILSIRQKSTNDTVEVFFLVSALSSLSTVGPVSKLILNTLGEELRSPIKELRLNTLWLRLVLSQKMFEAKVKVPQWLEPTFNPDRIELYKPIIFPSSQKLNFTHPFYGSLIPTVAAYDTWKTSKTKSRNNTGTSVLELVFHNLIVPSISEGLKDNRKYSSLKISFFFLKSLLRHPATSLSLVESVIHWLGSGGLACVRGNNREHVVQILLLRLTAVEQLNDHDKSQLAVCLLRAAVIVPEMASHLKGKLQHLSEEAAKSFVMNLVAIPWKKLTESEANILGRVVALQQCTGKDNLQWRLHLTDVLARKALRGPSQPTPASDMDNKDESEGREQNNNSSDEEQETLPTEAQAEADSYNFRNITNRELFFKYLSHASHDRSTCCDVLMAGHKAVLAQLKEEPEMRVTHLQHWDTVALELEKLEHNTDFPYKKTFAVLLSMAAYEMMDNPEEIPSFCDDLLECLQDAINETSDAPAVDETMETGSDEKKTKEMDTEEEVEETDGEEEKETEDDTKDWPVRLVEQVLLPLSVGPGAWYRPVLLLAGRELSSRIQSAEVFVPVLDAILFDDAFFPEEEDENNAKEDSKKSLSIAAHIENRGGANRLGDNDSDDDGGDEEEGIDGDREKDDDSDESDYSESEDDSDSDASNGGDSNDEEELPEGEENRIEAMKAALTATMVASGGGAPGDDLEDLEDVDDMDSVPLDQLQALDKKLAAHMALYADITDKKKKKNLHEIPVNDIRNRLLDLIEGVKSGEPSANVMLHGVVLPLVRALHEHASQKGSKVLVSRMRQVLRGVKLTPSGKSASKTDQLTLEQLTEALDELFSFSHKVSGAHMGVTSVLQYARHQQSEALLEAVTEAYLAFLSKMIDNGKINKDMFLDPLRLDIPGLRSRVAEVVVRGVFPCPGEGSTSEGDDGNLATDNGDDSTAGTSKKSGRRLRHAAIVLLQETLGWLLNTSKKLSTNDLEIVNTVFTKLIEHLQACKDPHKRQLEPISLMFKHVNKNSCASKSVEWTSLSSVLENLLQNKSSLNKKIRPIISRMETIARLADIPDTEREAKLKEEKVTLKRMRKESKKKKLEARKTRFEERKKNSSSQPAQKKQKKEVEEEGLFGAEGTHLDDSQYDSEDEEREENEKIDQQIKKGQSIKQKKLAKNSAKRLRAKKIKQQKKEALATKRAQLAKEGKDVEGDKILKKPKKKMTAQIKKNKAHVESMDILLDDPLKSGIFAKNANVIHE